MPEGRSWCRSRIRVLHCNPSGKIRLDLRAVKVASEKVDLYAVRRTSSDAHRSHRPWNENGKPGSGARPGLVRTCSAPVPRVKIPRPRTVGSVITRRSRPACHGTRAELATIFVARAKRYRAETRGRRSHPRGVPPQRREHRPRRSGAFPRIADADGERAPTSTNGVSLPRAFWNARALGEQ